MFKSDDIVWVISRYSIFKATVIGRGTNDGDHDGSAYYIHLFDDSPESLFVFHEDELFVTLDEAVDKYKEIFVKCLN
jgi:hypothetical protein